MKLKNSLRELPAIFLGTAIIAVAVYFFMLPSDLSVGSITALANVLSKFLPLPVSLLTFFFNGGLLLISLLLIGRDFAAKTAIYTIIITNTANK